MEKICEYAIVLTLFAFRGGYRRSSFLNIHNSALPKCVLYFAAILRQGLLTSFTRFALASLWVSSQPQISLQLWFTFLALPVAKAIQRWGKVKSVLRRGGAESKNLPKKVKRTRNRKRRTKSKSWLRKHKGRRKRRVGQPCKTFLSSPCESHAGLVLCSVVLFICISGMDIFKCHLP